MDNDAEHDAGPGPVEDEQDGDPARAAGPLKVLLVVGLVAGGAGRHVHELAAGLVRRGHRVMVAAPTQVEDQFGFSDAGARFVPIVVSSRPSPAHDVAAIRALGKLAVGADVVHAHGLRAGALSALARRGGTPLVVTLHNAAPEGRGSAAVYHLLEGVVARRADRVLGVSQDLVDRMRALGARGTGLAVIAAPAPRVLAPGTAERTRAALGVPAGRTLALVVARLAEQKGLPTLLDALGTLGRRERFTVLVAGEGPLREELQARIDAEQLPVRLLGHRDDVPALMAAADLAVSSAVWEGQPVWIQEVLQAGLPLVATDAGGTAAVVGDAARLVPVGDARALAEAVEEVATDRAVRGQLRLRARRRAGELPTAEDAVDAALVSYAQG